MLDVDPRVRDELERLLPPQDESGADWDSVLARVDDPRRRRRRPKLAITGAGLALAAFVVALAWPFADDRAGVLERALAAANDGPVLHVVFRSDRPTFTIIDLESGDRRDNVYPESELWYDPSRGFRQVGRIGNIVVHEDVGAAARDARLDTYALLAKSYRDALESGRASLVGPGNVDGTAVFWIRVWEALSRSVINGQVRFHQQAQEVAVSQESYEPVTTRMTIDGRPILVPPHRIVEFETLPADAIAFEWPSPPRGDEPNAYLCCRREAIPLGRAHAVIGRAPLWLGDRFRNLALRRARRVVGQTRKEGEREWTGTTTALELFYGSLTRDGEPDLTRPYFRILQAERLHISLARMAVAPEGRALVRGRTTTTTIAGLSIQIESGQHQDPDALLAAVQALEPIGSA